MAGKKSFVEDHVRSMTLVATADCAYFGQVAFTAGQPVPNTHPEVARWLEDGVVAETPSTVDPAPVDAPAGQ